MDGQFFHQICILHSLSLIFDLESEVNIKREKRRVKKLEKEREKSLPVPRGLRLHLPLLRHPGGLHVPPDLPLELRQELPRDLLALGEVLEEGGEVSGLRHRGGETVERPVETQTKVCTRRLLLLLLVRSWKTSRTCRALFQGG